MGEIPHDDSKAFVDDIGVHSNLQVSEDSSLKIGDGSDSASLKNAEADLTGVAGGFKSDSGPECQRISSNMNDQTKLLSPSSTSNFVNKGINDGGVFQGKAGAPCLGVESCSGSFQSDYVSTPEQKSSSRKRGRAGIDLNKNPQTKLKGKRYRPRIFDEAKPRKLPKSQKSKPPTEDAKSKTNRKNFVKKTGIKGRSTTLEEDVDMGSSGTNIMGLAVKENGATSNIESIECATPNPCTPQPSRPRNVFPTPSTDEKRKSLVNSSEQCFEQSGAVGIRDDEKSCRRALDFNLITTRSSNSSYQQVSEDFDLGNISIAEETLEGKRSFGSHSDSVVHPFGRPQDQALPESLQHDKGSITGSVWQILLDLNIERQDFDSCDGMKSILQEFQGEGLSMRDQDMNSWDGIENKLPADSSSLATSSRIRRRRVVMCQQKSRKVASRNLQTPKASRTRRQKTCVTENACQASISKENKRNFKKCRSLKGSTPAKRQKRNGKSEVSCNFIAGHHNLSPESLLERILPTENQVALALEDRESFKCVLRLLPLVNTKKKRCKRLAWKSKSKFLLLDSAGTTVDKQKSFNLALTLQPLVMSKRRRLNRVARRSNLDSFALNAFDCQVKSGSLENCMDKSSGHTSYDKYTSQPGKSQPLSPVLHNLFYHNNEKENVSKTNFKLLKRGFEGFLLNNKLYPPQQENANMDLQFKSGVDSATKNICTFEKSFVKDQLAETMELVIERLKWLDINDDHNQLMIKAQNAVSEMIPYKGKLGKPRKPKHPPAKVVLDPETLRVWMLLMANDGANYNLEADMEKEKWWNKQRDIFRGRVDSFTAKMHLVQGDRSFSRWKGSVVDSVIGVYLTQNVADYLSSSAFMSLAAKYPPQSAQPALMSLAAPDPPQYDCSDGSETVASHKESIRDDTLAVDELRNAEKRELSIINQTEEVRRANLRDGNGQSSIAATENLLAHPSEDVDDATLKLNPQALSSEFDFECIAHGLGDRKASEGGSSVTEVVVQDLKTSAAEKVILRDSSAKLINPQLSPSCTKECGATLEKNPGLTTDHHPRSRLASQAEAKKYRKKGKATGKLEEPIDWDQLRKMSANTKLKDRLSDATDSINWEAVRLATVKEIAKTIVARGMNNVIAERIKEFLNRILQDHGNIDLEWLRDVPPGKAKEYLMSIKGLGLKSVECVRLLTLHQLAFPVDTNVGRVAVRLGWVPLQPLPGDLQFHLLEQYPPVDAIQQYLWPRLCTLTMEELYLLHCQLIAFGKVFCKKKNPNCNACPMKGDCRHFASLVASSRLLLPGQEERHIVPTKATDSSDEPILHEIPLAVSYPANHPLHHKICSQDCEPIVELPDSPKADPAQTLERGIEDIEDIICDLEDDIPTIKLNAEVFERNLRDFIQDAKFSEEEMSRALVTLTPGAAQVPMPKLKEEHRLRTVHQAYELPSSHPLLAKFDRLDPDDPCPYLLAIWTTEKVPNSEDSSTCCYSNMAAEGMNRVLGTILIPCRTAMRGRFPLNGTYFQVNEVFADDESSQCPVKVPRSWIWNLPRRPLYCGKSITSICSYSSIREIQRCFWKGFICVRGFDRKTRAPKPLHTKFHFSSTGPEHGDDEQ